MTEGTVPWPGELALQYARAGWWRGRDLGAEFAVVAAARPDATALVDGTTRISYRSLLARVENLLYRMPGIAQVAAVAAPDAELGERICVFVVPEPGWQISLSEIRGGLDAVGVAKFKWPERLEIMAELPVTKMGKLDKKALREMLAGRSTA